MLSTPTPKKELTKTPSLMFYQEMSEGAVKSFEALVQNAGGQVGDYLSKATAAAVGAGTEPFNNNNNKATNKSQAEKRAMEDEKTSRMTLEEKVAYLEDTNKRYKRKLNSRKRKMRAQLGLMDSVLQEVNEKDHQIVYLLKKVRELEEELRNRDERDDFNNNNNSNNNDRDHDMIMEDREPVVVQQGVKHSPLSLSQGSQQQQGIVVVPPPKLSDKEYVELVKNEFLKTEELYIDNLNTLITVIYNPNSPISTCGL